MRMRGMHNEPRWFVDREQMVVLEENVEICRVRLDRARGGGGGVWNVPRQHAAGRDTCRGTANGLSIDADGSVVDPRLHAVARGHLEVRQMSAKHEIEPAPGVAAIAQESAERHVLASIVSASFDAVDSKASCDSGVLP